jgi:hypothetical protein
MVEHDHIYIHEATTTVNILKLVVGFLKGTYLASSSTEEKEQVFITDLAPTHK